VAKQTSCWSTIGANDLNPLESEGQQLSGDLLPPLISTAPDITWSDRGPPHGGPPNQSSPMVLVTDYWNVFQDGDVGTASHGAAPELGATHLTRR